MSLDELDDDALPRLRPRRASTEFGRASTADDQWADFEQVLRYVSPGRGAGRAGPARSPTLEEDLGGDADRLHYLSVPPQAAEEVVRMLGEAGLAERVADHHGEAVRHRPALGASSSTPACTQTFREDQIFRIDHFLGKEAAQNILAFRFANGLFEPIWNREHIDHVQIDVPETLPIGHRVGFYEGTGAYRDMVVTHLFQVLAFMAMEPPTALEPKAISEEKNKVFRSMQPIEPSDVVRGQYGGYRDEPGVPRALRHRDLRRPALRDRQLALGRRAVLPAHRQAHGRGRPHHLDRLPRAAEEHVPARLRAWARPGPTTSRSTWPTSSKLSLSFYGKRPGPGHAARQAEPPVLAARDRPQRRRPRGLRAADPTTP